MQQDLHKLKLGTRLRNKQTKKIYILRRFPIIKNYKEPRKYYLIDEDTRRDYITNINPSEWTAVNND